MSKDTPTKITPIPYTLQAFVTFMAEFAKSGQEPITIPETAELTDGEISVDINDDFMIMYNQAFPDKDLNEALEEMMTIMIEEYITKIENGENLDAGSETELDIPLA